MKYKPVTITLLCSLTATLGIIAHGQKDKNELASSANLEAGTNDPKINCIECVASGDKCNKIDTSSTVMKNAICGEASTKDNPLLKKKVLVKCEPEKGEKAEPSTTQRVDSVVSETRNCSPKVRYACLPAKISNDIYEKTGNGNYVYRWQDEVESPNSPGYPVCGTRSYCDITNAVNRPDDCDEKPPKK